MSETVTIEGVELALDPRVMSEHMIEVLRRGGYEKREVRAIPHIVRAGDCVVEIGAGIGLIATALAKLGIPLDLHAYEANPDLIPLIEQNQRLNGVRFEVFNEQVVASAPRGSAPFYIQRDFWASSSLPSGRANEQELELPATSLENVIRRHSPTVLILDVEGSERDLLCSCPLTGVDRLYIELHRKVIGPAGIEDIFSALLAQRMIYSPEHSSRSCILFTRID